MTTDRRREIYDVCCGVDSGIATTKKQKQQASDKILKSFNELVDVAPSSATIDNYHWYLRYLKLADAVAAFSKDPSTKTGSVIVDSKQRVVSTGFNGLPRGIADTDERLNNRSLKYQLILHAEENALMFAKQDLSDCTLFVTPLPPCSHCCLLIIQSGITKIVAPKLAGELERRWGKSIKLSKVLFKEANVKFIEI